MSNASQAHKVAVHGVNSLDERTLICTTAIAAQAWTNAVLITPIDASAIWTPVVGTNPVYTLGGAPTGVVINASTGEITGTPTVTGTFSLRVGVTDDESGEYVSYSNTFSAVVS